MIRDRSSVRMLILAAIMTLGASSLRAQEPAAPPSGPKADAPAARKGYDPARRLPNFYGQIGVTPEQREAIYKILAKHQAKIEAQQRLIAETRAEMMKECEAVLTETQKELLENRRRASTKEPAKPVETSLKSSGQ